MTEFEFTLKFRLPDADADPVAWVDALAAAGCDDAMLGLGQRGRIALAFVREARTAVDAMVSSIRDVEQHRIDRPLLVFAEPRQHRLQVPQRRRALVPGRAPGPQRE